MGHYDEFYEAEARKQAEEDRRMEARVRKTKEWQEMYALQEAARTKYPEIFEYFTKYFQIHRKDEFRDWPRDKGDPTPDPENAAPTTPPPTSRKIR